MPMEYFDDGALTDEEQDFIDDFGHEDIFDGLDLSLANGGGTTQPKRPKASLLSRFNCSRGKHRGMEKGDTMYFCCTACGETIHQPKDFRSLTAWGDMMLKWGLDPDEVHSTVGQAIQDAYGVEGE